MPASSAEFACVVVLAAGRGTRMGGPKALMEVGGRPWWHVQFERIAAVGRDQLWIVGPLVREAMGRDASRSPRLVDGDPGAPMFASVLRGIDALRADRVPRFVHVLPVDVPAPSESTFAALERAATASGVAVPTHRGASGHPICLARDWIERVIVPAVATAAIGELRLDALTARDRALVEVLDADVCVNLNEPEAVARWMANPARTAP
ncbi:MAG: nucleotidyltransferase family protein [Phycisphaerales bacterium]